MDRTYLCKLEVVWFNLNGLREQLKYLDKTELRVILNQLNRQQGWVIASLKISVSV